MSDDDDIEEYDEEYDSWRYPPSRPIRTERGIKAKTQRGAFGESWWAKRWIGALERLGYGSRLTRGRSYARQGQVLSIEVAPGQVRAKVQGSRPRPYDVTIALRPLNDVQWERVADALAEQAIFAAKLLAGEMPQDIEQAFGAAGAPLFPQAARDITASCSCPDAANPCKHIAAVHYLLGERFDEDPFLIFALRGRTQEQVVEALRARRAGPTDPGPAQEHPTPPQEEPLDALLGAFYQAGPGLDAIEVRIAAPEIETPLLRRLGPAPAGADDALREVYRRATQRALAHVLGDEG
ncbi:MAG: hypothetical protein RLZZ387_5024 [Chloroflexota bacterium]|jgi:uncharacterized Zn finger protein